MLSKIVVFSLSLIIAHQAYSAETDEKIALEKRFGPVKLPPSKTLLERLNKAGFFDFAKTTKIHETLGDKEFFPHVLGVSVAVEKALKVYGLSPQDNESTLLKVILQDFPDAIKELKEWDLIKD